MADDDKGRARVAKFRLQPLDRGKIEVICRLVQQKDVGLWRKNLGKGAAALLAAGQRRGPLMPGQTEAMEKVFGAVRITCWAQTANCGIEGGSKACQVGFLGEVADRFAMLHHALPAVRLD
jgi:hypothetical protein